MWTCLNLLSVLCRYCLIFLVLITTVTIFQNLTNITLKLNCFLDVELLYITSLITQAYNFLYVKNSESLASSVWCTRRLDGSKLCKFTNLYFLPQFRDHLIFLMNEESIISGIESAASLQDINLSSVKYHTKCNLKLVIFKSEEYILKQNLKVIHLNTLVMKRFKPDNIMHIVHDDLLPLFLTFHELCQGNAEKCSSTHQLMFLDDQGEGPYFEWYTLFSHHHPILSRYLSIGLCFKNMIIGLSQESTWFDYGFKNVQGPLINSLFNGVYLKKFTKFIKQKFEIQQNTFKLSEPVSIVLLNRTINRKILNGGMIKKYIEEKYQSVNAKKCNVLVMDLSVNSSRSLIYALQHSDLTIGMHGSAMVLAMFMPEGANIVELFPYGIQPEFVSPVKVLCSKPNVYYNYHAWVNKNESNSITHPEYAPLHGGILHLPFSEQHNIINTKLVPPVRCCHNPSYLFRIFQDTFVDESFYPLIDRVLSQTQNTKSFSSKEYIRRVQMNVYNQWYFPPPVFNLTCKCTERKLKLLWNFPINLSNVRFSVYLSNGFSFIVNSINFKMPVINCEHDSPIFVWVKTLEDSQESIDTYKQCN